MVKDIVEEYNFGRAIIMLISSFICAITSKRLIGFSLIAFTSFIILYSLFNVVSINTSNVLLLIMPHQVMAQPAPPDNGQQGGGQFGPPPSGQFPSQGVPPISQPPNQNKAPSNNPACGSKCSIA